MTYLYQTKSLKWHPNFPFLSMFRKGAGLFILKATQLSSKTKKTVKKVLYTIASTNGCTFGFNKDFFSSLLSPQDATNME